MRRLHFWLLALLLAGTVMLQGCAIALVAGGAAGGYMLAKDMEDGKFIDDPPKKKKEGNKGWFSGGKD